VSTLFPLYSCLPPYKNTTPIDLNPSLNLSHPLSPILFKLTKGIPCTIPLPTLSQFPLDISVHIDKYG
jgi:hypothetical protein